jgi:hypothetical protein
MNVHAENIERRSRDGGGVELVAQAGQNKPAQDRRHPERIDLLVGIGQRCPRAAIGQPEFV